MSRVERTLSFSAVLSPAPSTPVAPPAVSTAVLATHTECFIEIYDYSPLLAACVRLCTRRCVRRCVRTRGTVPVPCVRPHMRSTRSRTRSSASPFLHIIYANNILCTICMPLALSALNRENERCSRTRVPVIAATAPFDHTSRPTPSTRTLCSHSSPRLTSRSVSAPSATSALKFPRAIHEGARFARGNSKILPPRVSLFAVVYFSQAPRSKRHRVFRGTFGRRSMTSENTFGGNESDSNPSCISGRVR